MKKEPMDIENVSRIECEQYAGEWNCKVFFTPISQPPKKPTSFFDWEQSFKRTKIEHKEENIAANLPHLRKFEIVSGQIERTELTKNKSVFHFNDEKVRLFIERGK